MKQADLVYETLLKTLEEQKWTYRQDRKNRIAHFDLDIEGYSMSMGIGVDEKQELITLLSRLPVIFEEKTEGAAVTCAANFDLLDGSFDYDVAEGSVTYRATAPMFESRIGPGLFQYMIFSACQTVRRFQPNFRAVSQKRLSVDEFLSRL